MNDKIKRLLNVLLLSAIVLFQTACGRSGVETAKAALPVENVEPTQQPSYAELAPKKAEYTAWEVWIAGQAADYCYYREGTLYMDPLLILKEMGVEDISLACEAGNLCIADKDNIALKALHGEKYICVNGRYLYMPNEFFVVGEKAFLPEETIEKIFNVQIVKNEGKRKAEIDLGEISLISGGKYYYDVNFSGDDIYWLSHIIEAEAGNQPLEGMIGVGNVVLNRVESEDFPDTVFDVIFEYNNTAQFSPKASTSMGWTVSEKTMAATYLCLEGYSTAEGCLFFQNPAIIDTNWITMTREYAVTLGDMDFYY